MAEIEVELRDGSWAVVRPIEAGDRDAIRGAFGRLSDETRYRRFLGPVASLTEAQLDYLTDVDHRDHEALIAFDPVTRNGIGVARFVRDPNDPAVAEAAVVVADEWQGRGLGSILCQLLAERARDVGIERFLATLLAVNRPMIRLLESVGPARMVSEEGPTITFEVTIPAQGIGEQMRGLLRATARGLAQLARVPGTERAAN
jgi:GNAT superfamily N-acetyltransferase